MTSDIMLYNLLKYGSIVIFFYALLRVIFYVFSKKISHLKNIDYFAVISLFLAGYSGFEDLRGFLNYLLEVNSLSWISKNMFDHINYVKREIVFFILLFIFAIVCLYVKNKYYRPVKE